MSRRSTELLVVGGGLTGLSAALHAGRPFLLCERDSRPGGHARSDGHDGFLFDRTGHWLHLRDPEMRRLVDEATGKSFVEVARTARIFSSGVLTRYPFQANLLGLPPAVAADCLLGFIHAWQRKQAGSAPAPHDFHEYILHHFGEGIARHFMVPYNHKLWGVHPREITAAWCSRFVPIPTLEDVVAGALGASPPELGYNQTFLYPPEGGIETLVRALARRLPAAAVCTGAEVEWIDLERREAGVGGEVVGFGAAVATLPLPELARRVRGLPDALAAAAARLRWTSVRYLNLAARSVPPERFHWIYAPEEAVPFFRAGVFTNAAPSMAPPGCAALYVELAARGPRPDAAARQALIADAARWLAAAGALASPEDVLFADLEEIDPAYVVFDENHLESVAALHAWFEARGLFPRGRYGSWTYNGMEDCLLLGRDGARAAAAFLAARS